MKKMSCETCKNKAENLTEETKAIRGASEMAQRYKFLCGAVVALVIGFVVMAGCMVYTVTNAQRIANEAATEAIKSAQETMNEAVLEALYAMADMEVSTETTTQTVEGDSATINNGEWQQYNDNAVNQGGGN